MQTTGYPLITFALYSNAQGKQTVRLRLHENASLAQNALCNEHNNNNRSHVVAVIGDTHSGESSVIQALINRHHSESVVNALNGREGCEQGTSSGVAAFKAEIPVPEGETAVTVCMLDFEGTSAFVEAPLEDADNGLEDLPFDKRHECAQALPRLGYTCANVLVYMMEVCVSLQRNSLNRES